MMEPRGTEGHRGADHVSLPELRLPAREARLRRELMALSRQSQTNSRRLKEAFTMRMRKVLAPLLAAVAVAGSIAVFAVFNSVATTPVVFATLQVNPAFTMAINSKGEVVEVTTHGKEAEQLFKAVDLAGMSLKDAVARIAEVLGKAGHLVPENDVSVAVHPAERGKDEDVSKLAATLEAELKNALGDKVVIVVVTLSAEDYAYLEDNDLLPGDYANIVADTGTIEAIRKLLEASMPATNGVTPEEQDRKLRAAVYAFNEMIAVGIAREDALALINAGLAANLSLYNITQFGWLYEELVAEAGMTGPASLALMNKAINSGLLADDIGDMADLRSELLELGVSPEEAGAVIDAQIAVGWDAKAVERYIEQLEERKEANEENYYDAPAPAPVPVPVAPPAYYDDDACDTCPACVDGDESSPDDAAGDESSEEESNR